MAIRDADVVGECALQRHARRDAADLEESGVAVRSRRRAVRLLRRHQGPGRRAGPADRAQVATAASATRRPTCPRSAPGRRPAGRPAPLRRRRPAVAALPDGLRDRAPGRLADRRRSPRAMSRSARCSARTASRSRPVRARRSGWSTCWTRRSSGPGAVVAEKSADLTEDEIAERAAQVGHRRGEVRRPVQHRARDYIFDLDRMVSLNGDTSVYLQYAHARIRSILARAAMENAAATGVEGAALTGVEDAALTGLGTLPRRGDADRAGAVPRPRARRLRRGADRRRPDLRAASALRLPVRAGPGGDRVRRAVSGPQGRPRGTGAPAGAVPTRRPDPAPGSGSARDRRPGAAVGGSPRASRSREVG